MKLSTLVQSQTLAVLSLSSLTVSTPLDALFHGSSDSAVAKSVSAKISKPSTEFVDKKAQKTIKYSDIIDTTLPKPFDAEDDLDARLTEGRMPDGNGTLLLYPKARSTLAGGLPTSCSTDLPSRLVDIAPETCLSGDYLPSQNILFTKAPECADGLIPRMVLYPRQRCAGKPMFVTSDLNRLPLNTCLTSEWFDNQEQWSLVFRCSVWPTLVDGADSYEVANPPHELDSITKSTLSENSKDGANSNSSPILDDTAGEIYATFSPPACSQSHRGRGSYSKLNEPVTAQVDTCIRTSTTSIQISRAATCPNGTVAKLARFVDSECEISMPDGLLFRVAESDINQCLSKSWMETPGAKANSVAFWCEGFENFKTLDPKQDPSSCSTSGHSNNIPDSVPKWKSRSELMPPHESCGGGWSHQSIQPPSEHACAPAPVTFSRDFCGSQEPSKSYEHYYPDTCVSLTYNTKSSLQILNPGRCANGTRPVFKKFEDNKCTLPHSEPLGIADETLGSCLDISDLHSVAFSCGNDIVQIPSRPANLGISYSHQRITAKVPVWLIVKFSVVSAMITSILAVWICTCTRAGRKIKRDFRRKSGAIAI